jgi:hypothetical protein
MTLLKQRGLKRTVLWWMVGGALTVTAGEAEHVRRQDGPGGPGVCIGSTLLLQGTACSTLAYGGRANPL